MAKLLKGVFKMPLLGVLGSLLGKKKSAAALPPPTRDDAAAQIAAEDEPRRRKGAAADMITGTRGAEAVGSVGRLVVGN